MEIDSIKALIFVIGGSVSATIGVLKLIDHFRKKSEAKSLIHKPTGLEISKFSKAPTSKKELESNIAKFLAFLTSVKLLGNQRATAGSLPTKPSNWNEYRRNYDHTNRLFQKLDNGERVFNQELKEAVITGILQGAEFIAEQRFKNHGDSNRFDEDLSTIIELDSADIDRVVIEKSGENWHIHIKEESNLIFDMPAERL